MLVALTHGHQLMSCLLFCKRKSRLNVAPNAYDGTAFGLQCNDMVSIMAAIGEHA